MALIDKQKAVIENNFNKKGWNAYKIWEVHPGFKCFCRAVHNLIKKIKETGSTECRKGSGRPVTATIEENALMFQDEKDFFLKAPKKHQNNRVYFNVPKKGVQPERLYSEGLLYHNLFEKGYGIRSDNLKRCKSAFLNWWKWNHRERSLQPEAKIQCKNNMYNKNV